MLGRIQQALSEWGRPVVGAHSTLVELSAYVADRLSPSDVAKVDAHLRTCVICAERAAQAASRFFPEESTSARPLPTWSGPVGHS